MTKRRPRRAPAPPVAETRPAAAGSVAAVAPPAAVSVRRIALTLIAFVIAFVTLTGWSLTSKSATWDEPVHLTDGYLSLAKGDYRVDSEHPPFARMWAALPLAFMSGITVDTVTIDRTASHTFASFDLFLFARQFLYVENDADRLLYAARFMVVTLGVLLGVMVFFWVYEWLGYWPAVVALALCLLEPNLVAHSQLVTTDLPVTTFMFGAVYFLWRFARRSSPLNAAGVVAFATLSVLTRYSAVLLVPVMGLLLAATVIARRVTVRQAALIFVTSAVVSWTAIWGAYGFRWEPSPTPGWVFHFQDLTRVRQAVPGLTDMATWVDGNRLLPNAFTQGFLLSQMKAQNRAGYLAGNYSEEGWWYFFPLAFLLKTPIGLLVLAAFAVPAFRRPRGEALSLWYVACPILVYLAVAMTTSINIGLRHILPIYPFVILLAALAARHLLKQEQAIGRAIVAASLTLVAVEAGRAYPDSLAFFNQLVGGPSGGHRYLVDSSLDWGQDLKPLKQWMTRQGVDHINLAYFGSADPKYYGIECTYLPGAPLWIPRTEVSLPKLPGYVALSATAATGIYLEANRDFYKPLAAQTPVASIGHTIDVYWVEKPWW